MRLEDMEGQVEVLVFPKAYRTCEPLLEKDRAVLVVGRCENEEGRIRIIGDSITPLDALRETRADAVQVRLDAALLDEQFVTDLMQAVQKHSGDASLFLEVARPGRFRLVARAESALRVAPSPALTRALESVVGPGRVRYRAPRASR